MSAVLEAREPNVGHLQALEPALVRRFDLLVTAPNGVARLRQIILTLAVQGKLVTQDPDDEPAIELLSGVQKAKARASAAQTKSGARPIEPILDEELPFQLPPGWAWSRFGDFVLELCTGPFGSLIHKEDYVIGGVPLINPSHMIEGRIVHDASVSVPPDMAAKLIAYRLSAGDVLLARRGEVGRYALVTCREEGWLCGTGSFFVKMTADSHRPFFGLLMDDPRFRRYLLGESVGATMTNLNQRILLHAVLGVPPLAEQVRIVARVDELMRLCDALEAKGQLEAEQHARLLSTLLGTLTDSASPEELAVNWQRVADHFDLLLDRPEAVDALEQSILQLAVRGLLVPQDPDEEPASISLERIRAKNDPPTAKGSSPRAMRIAGVAREGAPFRLPATWVRTQIGEIVDLLNGYAFKSEWFKGSSSMRLLRNVNVGHLRVDWSQSVFLDEEFAKTFKRFDLEEGDIVLSLDRPIISTGLKCAVVGSDDLPCLLLQRVARLSPRPEVLTRDYLMLWLRSDLFVGNIDPGRSNGVPHISTKQVAAMAFELPPIDEQARIVARVDQLHLLCVELRNRFAARQATKGHLAEVLIEQFGA